MPKKSVYYRFLDNPVKYQNLIGILFGEPNLPDNPTYEFLRKIFNEVFLCVPSREEILQLRNFICSRRECIKQHISLWNVTNHHMILLKEHHVDISNKLKLFDVIVHTEFHGCHFGRHLISEVMEKAWQDVRPANAVSLVTNFLKNHYAALKMDKFLAIPEKCKGYKIIMDNLVYLERREFSTPKFRDRSLSEQAITLLSWMNLSERRMDELISSEYLLDTADNNTVGDAFFDDEVQINILKNFIREDAFQKLLQVTDKSSHTFTCGKCSKAVSTNCIRCDTCLLWYHYCCAGIKPSATKSLLDNVDYYCFKCTSN